MNWRDAVGVVAQHNEPHVLVTVLQVDGSAPRDAGAKMLVTRLHNYDTIGGGQLEYLVINRCRELLAGTSPLSRAGQNVHISHQVFNLSRDASQCCGGRVSVMFEHFKPAYAPLVLCGAGHVGQALLGILSELPVRISVLDSRQDWLEKANLRLQVARQHRYATASVDAAGERIDDDHPDVALLDAPHLQIAECEPDAVFLVMTHSHELDFELCEAILSRPSNSWCGLIASRSKAASFRKRFGRLGFSETELARLAAPVGLRGGDKENSNGSGRNRSRNYSGGKEPMAVAIDIAAQLMALPQFNKRIGKPREHLPADIESAGSDLEISEA